MADPPEEVEARVHCSALNCPQVSPSHVSFVRHFREVHGEIWFDCPGQNCSNNSGEGYPTVLELVIHLKSKHGELSPTSALIDSNGRGHCPHMGCLDNSLKGFNTLAGLNNHIRSKHPRDKIQISGMQIKAYYCTQPGCSKGQHENGYPRISLLNVHLKGHGLPEERSSRYYELDVN